MEELIRTNNPVTISFVEALMRDAGIGTFVADQNMSIIEGSIGAIPKRLLVESDRFEQAKRIVKDAGLEHELRSGG
ncbi:MAG: DUF2007 domain-containing protein [Pseudomonadota bacterium]